MPRPAARTLTRAANSHMKTTLSTEMFDAIRAKADATGRDEERATDGPSQPVHVLYGGAHLFKYDSPARLARIAQRAFRENIDGHDDLAALFNIDTWHAPAVYERISAKLGNGPIQDLRLDFEDGYGIRSDGEEDAHAETAAAEVARALDERTLPPFTGIRVKPLTKAAGRRALRTLDIFITELTGKTGGRLPDNFVITLPKVESPEQVSALARALEELERGLGLEAGIIPLEIMIETPAAIIDKEGRVAMRSLVDAACGRCRGAHFGAYDYTASLGITSQYQDIQHQACDFARNMMQASLAGSGVWLSDGATNVMPIGPHRGDGLSDEQTKQNRDTIRRAWQLHYRHCRASLANGFYQGWDLHPAQLVTRYAAIYAMFLEELDPAGRRLRGFVEKAAQASLVGDKFDDAATGQGLLNFFVRGIDCGALSTHEAAQHSGLTAEQLRSGSFAAITGITPDRA
jgi:citrate lyase beta subunit